MGILDFFIGGDDEDEDTRTTIQRSRIPEEISPYATDLLQDAQKLYRERLAAGVPVYDAPRIAPLTPDQLASQEGLKALVGTSAPLYEEALAGYRGGREEFVDLSPEELETYMSPYQRAKTDIEKREAQRDFESKIMPQFEKQAERHGGMSGLGTRAGIQAAELGRSQMQRLGDIEARGLQSAYMDAQNLYKEGQDRKRLAAQDIAKTIPARFASGLSEQGVLKTIGGEEQALAQRALDQAYARFKEKQDYPQQQLADYSKFVYGNPLMAQRDVTTVAPRAPSTTGRDLMGLGAGAFNMFGRGGGFSDQGFSMGNLFGGAAEGGGIASLPVVARQDGSKVLNWPLLDENSKVPEESLITSGVDTRLLPAPKSAPAPSTISPPKTKTAPPEKPLTYEDKIKALFAKEKERRKGTPQPGFNFPAFMKGLRKRGSLLSSLTGGITSEAVAHQKQKEERRKRDEAGHGLELQEHLKRLAAKEKAEALLKAARVKAGVKTGKAFTGTWKEVKDSIAAKYGFVLDEHGTIKLGKDQFLDTDSKGYKDYMGDLNIANTEFLKFLKEAGDESYGTQVLASQQAFKKVAEARAKRKGGEAGDSGKGPIQLTPELRKTPDKLEHGKAYTWIDKGKQITKRWNKETGKMMDL